MSKTLEQIYVLNPSTVIADTDLLYLVESPYTPGTDSAITGADLKAMFPSGTPSALTRTNDSNVTVTLGGTPATSLLQPVSLTMGWSGQLPVARGGTGDASFTAFSVICGGTTSTGPLQNVSGTGTSGEVLTSNGPGQLPTWQAGSVVTPAALTRTDDTNVTLTLGGSPSTALLQATSLTLGWSGQLAVSRGGTGLSSATLHNLMIGNGTSALTLLPPSSTSGIPLVSLGASLDPAYGTAVVAGGGTGNTTFTAYSVICAGTSATGAFQNVSGTGTSGEVLTSNGAGGLPTWQASTGGVTPLQVQENAFNLATDIGVVNAYEVVLNPMASIPDGLEVFFSPISANTISNPTLTVNGFTAFPIALQNAGPLLPGDLDTNHVAHFIYSMNSSQWVLQNPFCSLQQFYNCLQDTGTANSYIVTLPPGLVANPQGITFTFSPANSNTTISFIDFGFGPIQIVKDGQQPLIAGDILQDVNCIIIFAPNLTTAQLINPQTPGGVWQFGTGIDSGVGGDGTNTANGSYSLAYGSSISVSDGLNSFAFGDNAVVFSTASFSMAFGQSSFTNGNFSFTFGAACNAAGSYSFAFGNGAVTSPGDYNFAMGNFPVCNNAGSVVWGDSNVNPISDTAVDQWVTTFAGGYYWWLSTGNLAVSIDTGGILENHFGLRDLSRIITGPSSGSTVTINSAANYLTILDPAGTLATLTIDFGTASDGIKFKVTTTQIISSITCTAGTDTIAVPVTSLVAGGGFEMIYDLATTTWYPA